MKPNFALNLSHDGISLLHRTPGGWHHVGAARLDDPALKDQLRYLRQTAIELDQAGLTAKLIIPNSQILFTEVEAPGPTDEERVRQIRFALIGMTPYEVEELAFDWRANGERAQVAAVALETLDEAESFALEHRFNPVSFAAIPDEGDFEGEPFFGEAQSAAEFIEEGERVEPDAFALKVVPLPEATGTLETTVLPGSTRVEPPTGDGPAGEARGPTPPTPSGEEADGEPAAGDAPEERAPCAQPPADGEGAGESGDTGQAGTAGPDDAAQPRESLAPKAEDDAPPANPQADSATTDSAVEEPDGGEARHEPERRVSGDAEIEACGEDHAAFSTRRTGETAEDSETEHLLPRGRIAVLPGAAPGDAPRVGPARKAAGVTAASAPDLPQPRGTSAPPPRVSAADLPEGEFAPMAAAADSLAPREPGSPTAPPPAVEGAPPAATIAARGAGLANFSLPHGSGLSRRKLAYLAAFLLLVLIAALAVTLLTGGAPGTEGQSRSGNVDTPPLAEQASEEAPATATGEAVAREEAARPATRAATGQEATDTAAQERPIADEAPAVAPAPPLTKADASALHAATGAWPLAPSAPQPLREDSLDPLYAASLDPRIGSHDAVALPTPDPEPNLTRPEALFDPAPQGTEFVLDEGGRVRPAPGGAMNPDGILVHSGPPPVRPGPRPVTVALPAGALPTGTAARLAGYRPPARPDNLRELFERGRFGGLTLAELAARRPPPKPASPQSDPALDSAPTRLAVARSLVPRERPDDMDALVAAVAAARAQAAVSGGAAATTAAAVQTPAAPRIPTSASVARQATIENAINLRRTALIGIYGSASNRRALVRLRNGRYRRVTVGDRLDGGRVAAITDSALQYVKGSRSITLQMPDT